MGLETDRPTPNQVLREEELAVHPGIHRTHPMVYPRCGGVDLHRQRVLIFYRDVDPAFARLGLAAARVCTRGECQEQCRYHEPQFTKHVPSQVWAGLKYADRPILAPAQTATAHHGATENTEPAWTPVLPSDCKAK